MATMFVKQRVADFNRWKTVFDEQMAGARAEHGLSVTGIYRDINDAGTILLTLDLADMQRAREFAQSGALDKGRQDALGGSRTDAEVWFSDAKMKVT